MCSWAGCAYHEEEIETDQQQIRPLQETERYALVFVLKNTGRMLEEYCKVEVYKFYPWQISK